MARYSEVDRSAIDATVDLWRTHSLIGDASFTCPDDAPTCWAEANVSDLRDRFLGKPLLGAEGGGRFESKWDEQLDGSSRDVRLMAGELLLVYYLITAGVGARRKLDMVNKTIADPSLTLASGDSAPFVRALNSWIANPGIHYNTRQDIQVGYLMDLCLRLKRLPSDEREPLLTSQPWEFGDFADAPGPDVTAGAMRHVICHLLYPEHYERIASVSHKRQILDVFGGLAPGSDEADVDRRLYSIRQVLEAKMSGPPARHDYYNEPLKSIWRPQKDGVAELSPLAALKHKGQIVFYGPPGTGKTYQARELAESVIRSAAVARWGIENYFSNLEAVDTAVNDHVVRLQLHPGIGYPEFIIGLQLAKDGSTRYELGVLPKLVDEMQQPRADGLPCLPRVLVLDEINRTDLSAMFGEAFSAIEPDKRGTDITLPRSDDGQAPPSLSVPTDLFLVGTMNEIDHSVEALDFALRRRFFWFPARFERDALFAIWEDRWRDAQPRFPYDEHDPQLQQLADNIVSLNQQIGSSRELGSTYELGHAFFADLPFFVKENWPTRKPQGGRFLWDAKGSPLMPVTALWTYSIKPLLDQYLAVSDEKDTELSKFEATFVHSTPPSP